ncbi:uncharacterized protein LOC6038259 [Culex quinquefasciatus]|uniref:uncharacterized protein LOC6038259 n=1 Tax=Culex quinquefasciatus TaxID=7176 RepID=UPI0018E37AAC|nr:uncharacterized protein LOC6038259 [Culex quinquefasciatus]
MTKPEEEKKPDQKPDHAGKLIGSLENFVPGSDFEDYLERAENFFELNQITDDGFKRQLIVHFIGLPALRKLQQLLYPKTHKDVTYVIVTDKLKAYFCPKRNRIAQSVEFFKRNQQEFEKVADFAVELQALSKNCVFGNYLDKALRDKFVAGIVSPKIQGELMNSTDDMTFEQAVDKAKVLEQIELDVMTMKNKNGNLNRVNAGRWSRKDGNRSASRGGHRSNSGGRGTWKQKKNGWQRDGGSVMSNGGRRNGWQRAGGSVMGNGGRSHGWQRAGGSVMGNGGQSWKKGPRCFNCSEFGHIARYCRYPREKLNAMASGTEDEESGSSSDESRAHGVNHVASPALYQQL